MDTAKSPEEQLTEKKPPRKPRPSEIAAKKAKAAKKRKPAPKAKKVKRTVKPKPKAKKAAKRPAKKAKKPAAGSNVIRTERLDFRLSKKEKAKLIKAAKAQKRTITGVIQVLIEKLS